MITLELLFSLIDEKLVSENYIRWFSPRWHMHVWDGIFYCNTIQVLFAVLKLSMAAIVSNCNMDYFYYFMLAPAMKQRCEIKAPTSFIFAFILYNTDYGFCKLKIWFVLNFSILYCSQISYWMHILPTKVCQLKAL